MRRRGEATPAADLLGGVVTPDGTRRLGGDTTGCRHCGHRAVKYSTDGNVELVHPGTDCCAAAINDQIGWREGDLKDLRNATNDDQAVLDAERNRGLDAIGREAAAITATVGKIARANDVRLRRRTEQAADLKAEVRDLKAALAVQTTGEAQRLPRPYAEDS